MAETPETTAPVESGANTQLNTGPQQPASPTITAAREVETSPIPEVELTPFTKRFRAAGSGLAFVSDIKTVISAKDDPDNPGQVIEGRWKEQFQPSRVKVLEALKMSEILRLSPNSFFKVLGDYFLYSYKFSGTRRLTFIRPTGQLEMGSNKFVTLTPELLSSLKSNKYFAVGDFFFVDKKHQVFFVTREDFARSLVFATRKVSVRKTNVIASDFRNGTFGRNSSNPAESRSALLAAMQSGSAQGDEIELAEINLAMADQTSALLGL